MTLLHSTVLAVTVAAIAFVGIASVVTGHEAATVNAESNVVAPRGDRLDIAAGPDRGYVTIEKRVDGVSVLTRIQTAHE